jgi:hypothetical protein
VITNDKKKAPKRASENKAAPPKTEVPKTGRGKSQKTVVQEIRKRVEDKLSTEVDKASLGDYIRLVALEKELVKESVPTEMTVTWVEDSEK